jgi:short-subunit dehydrogenase
VAELDRRTPIDLLLVHAGAAELGRIEPPHSPGELPEAEITAAMDAVAALAEPMRQRQRGRIVLVSSLIGRAWARELATLIAGRRALLAYGEALRFRLRGHGVSVTTVVPGDFALRAVARYRQPVPAAISADRAAARIMRAARAARPVVAIPCRAAVALRMLHLVPRMLRDWTRDGRAGAAGAAAEPIDETAWRGGSAAGD